MSEEMDVRIMIMIEEIDGKLNVVANIPEEAANTVAGALATSLLRGAKEIMDQSAGQEGRFSIVKSN